MLYVVSLSDVKSEVQRDEIIVSLNWEFHKDIQQILVGRTQGVLKTYVRNLELETFQNRLTQIHRRITTDQ